MLFGDKIKELRTLAGMSQQELASNAGLSLRSIQNYESNKRYPKDVAILNKLCKALDTTIEDLMSDKDNFVQEATTKYGTRGKKDAKKLVEEVGGLFAGGELNEEDKDKVFRAITEIYWRAKDNNRNIHLKQFSHKTKGMIILFFMVHFIGENIGIASGGENMTNKENIQALASNIVKRFDTRDPFELCKSTGVEVFFADLGSLKGMYKYIKRNRFAVINENLDERTRRLVCAHELGHDLLHRDLAKNICLQEFVLYDMKSRPEYEANLFAAENTSFQNEVFPMQKRV